MAEERRESNTVGPSSSSSGACFPPPLPGASQRTRLLLSCWLCSEKQRPQLSGMFELRLLLPFWNLLSEALVDLHHWVIKVCNTHTFKDLRTARPTVVGFVSARLPPCGNTVERREKNQRSRIKGWERTAEVGAPQGLEPATALHCCQTRDESSPVSTRRAEDHSGAEAEMSAPTALTASSTSSSSSGEERPHEGKFFHWRLALPSGLSCCQRPPSPRREKITGRRMRLVSA